MRFTSADMGLIDTHTHLESFARNGTLAGAVGLGLQLYRTRQQLADARNAPTLEVKRTEIHTSTAPALNPRPSAPEALETAANDMPAAPADPNAAQPMPMMP